MSSGLEKGQKDILEAKEKKIKELTSKVESLETDVEKLMFEKAALEKVIIQRERTVPKVPILRISLVIQCAIIFTLAKGFF